MDFEVNEKTVFHGLHEAINASHFDVHLNKMRNSGAWVLMWRFLQRQHCFQWICTLLQITISQEKQFCCKGMPNGKIKTLPEVPTYIPFLSEKNGQ